MQSCCVMPVLEVSLLLRNSPTRERDRYANSHNFTVLDMEKSCRQTRVNTAPGTSYLIKGTNPHQSSVSSVPVDCWQHVKTPLWQPCPRRSFPFPSGFAQTETPCAHSNLPFLPSYPQCSLSRTHIRLSPSVPPECLHYVPDVFSVFPLPRGHWGTLLKQPTH